MKKMIRSILSVFFISIALSAEGVQKHNIKYDPAKWPVVELKLSNAATLKDFFDSGLRPYLSAPLKAVRF